MRKKYYTLFLQHVGSTNWSPEWGSYVRAEVQQEARDLCYPRSRYRIVMTGDSQAEVNTAQELLNSGVAV